MKSTWILLLALALGMSALRSTQAAITFSLAPSNAQIPQGSTAVFEVFISSPTQETIGGYSLNVLAGPGNGSAGVFSTGSFNFLVGAPNQNWDLTSTPGQAFSTADTGASGGTGTGAVLAANTSTRLGTLTLNTTGVATGQYQMSLSSLSAIQLNGLPISGSATGALNGGPITYNVIAAVPEAGSLWMMSVASFGILFAALYRKFNLRSAKLMP